MIYELILSNFVILARLCSELSRFQDRPLPEWRMVMRPTALPPFSPLPLSEPNLQLFHAMLLSLDCSRLSLM